MDLVGKRFGKWAVLEYSHHVGNHKYWLCRCDCGNIKPVRQQNLVEGKSKSCGSCHGEKNIGDRTRKHGDFGKPLYCVWAAMKRRCFNKNVAYYEDYGGRGITVCDEWIDYIPFKEWALSTGYEEGLTIERIDVNGNYCPENCKWISLSEQNKNKRNSVRIEYNGQSYSIKEIAEITGLKERTVRGRYERGWTPEQIFSKELKKNQY